MYPSPTRGAALECLASVDAAAYARTRNHLEGAVTGLSPYLTHGLLTLPEVLANVLGREPLALNHKFVQELGWREFFRHVWSHAGSGIFQSLHAGPLQDEAYASRLPADIREGRTGVPVIDQAVHTLYTTGTLHNHARMWLASYVVHLRKVHWRRLAGGPPAGRRPRQQPPELAVGGRHRQPQALFVQCRERGALCAGALAQPWLCA